MILTRLSLILPLAVATACEPADALQTEATSRFQRDPARLQAKQAQLVEATRAQDSNAARQLEAAFNQDIVAAVAPALRPYGFSTDDVIDMTAVYWINAWEAVHGKVGATTDPAMAKGVRAQLAKAMVPSLARLDDAGKQDIADTMLLQALIVDAQMQAARSGGAAQIKAASDAIHAQSSALLKTDLRQIEMTTAGFRPLGSGKAAAAPAPSPKSGGGGRTPPVSGYYFRATYGLGATISFEPLVFFGNGEYVELDKTPLPDLNAAADKAASPVRWGRWQKQGGKFLLTNNKGRTHDYQLGSGNFFPAYPAPDGPRLSGTYSSTTGGGDYMVGGSVSTLAVNRITFDPDGSFTQDKNAGGIAPGAAIGNKSAAAGKWRLDGSTLELAYADGRRLRTSFLWGASGKPARPDVDMAFIGGDVFTRDD